MNDMSAPPDITTPGARAILDTLVLEMSRKHLQTFVSERYNWTKAGPGFRQTLRTLIDAGLITTRRAPCLRNKSTRTLYRRTGTATLDMSEAEALMGQAWKAAARREGHMKRHPAAVKGATRTDTRRDEISALLYENGPMPPKDIGAHLGLSFDCFKNDLYTLRTEGRAHSVPLTGGRTQWRHGPAPVKTQKVRT